MEGEGIRLERRKSILKAQEKQLEDAFQVMETPTTMTSHLVQKHALLGSGHSLKSDPNLGRKLLQVRGESDRFFFVKGETA